MRTGIRVLLSTFAMAASLTACTKGGGGALSAVASPATGATLDKLVAASRDCLQYPIETRADGTVVWNADYFYFDLFDAKSHKPAVDAAGKPLAAALFPSQAVEFMRKNPGLESSTDWGVRISRQVQEVKDGKATLRPGATIVYDFNIDSLLALDANARKR
jgi:hypothetical protein